MKFELTVDDKQLRVILDALDMYSRMGMGQLDVSVEEFLRMHFLDLYYNVPAADGVELTRGSLVREHVNEIKALVFGHHPNSSWGIFNDKVPRVCREAYDIQQVAGKALAEARLRQAQSRGATETARHIAMTVDMRNYMASNPDWPPIQAREVPEKA